MRIPFFILALAMQIVGVSLAAASAPYMGKWKDSVIWTDSSMGSKVSAKLDGKEYPAAGATFGPRLLARKKTGLNPFETTVRYQGKPVYVSHWVGSADGKMLTETGEAVQPGEKYKAVYDRQ